MKNKATSYSKLFRIFVSSTFGDMAEERNALQRDVFPRLREFCERHGYSFTPVDLRWGVSNEAGLDQKTMSICMDEIKHCQLVSPRPNFIIILGNRYGWRPIPHCIYKSEFESVLDEISRFYDNDNIEKEKALSALKKWYRIDLNAVPAVYYLQPRKINISDVMNFEEIKTARELENAEWEDIEEYIRKTFYNVFESVCDMLYKDDKTMAMKQKIKYQLSATSQEIVDGALLSEDSENHVFAFIRNISNIGDIKRSVVSKNGKAARRFIDYDSKNNSFDGSAEEMLEKIKNGIYKKIPNNIFEYECSWLDQEGVITNDHIKKFCADVYNCLEKVIIERISSDAKIGSVKTEITNHLNFAIERSALFTGRTEYLKIIENYLWFCDGNTKIKHDAPLALYGAGGSGKSALLSKSIIEHLEKNDDKKTRIFFRFFGTTPESSNIYESLSGLCEQLDNELSPDKSAAGKYSDLKIEDLENAFRELLKKTGEKYNTLIFLDAIDQLSNDGNADQIRWIPINLPKNVKIVFSFLDQSVITSAVKSKISPENIIKLSPMTVDEGASLLDAWLNIAKRNLDGKQKKYILDKFSENGLPLYLKLAFEEARNWRDEGGGNSEIVELPGKIKDIIKRLFERLSAPANHGSLLVSKVLGYLAASKTGLAEDELLDILALDKEYMTDLTDQNKISYHKLPERKVPAIIWSRLYRDLAPYLTQHSGEGFSLLTFFHGTFNEVASELYLSSESKLKYNFNIARYFEVQKLYSENSLNLRKLSKLPFHLAASNQWKKLYELLSDIEFFKAISENYNFELRVYWASIESKSKLRLLDAYQKIIKTPGEMPVEIVWEVALFLIKMGYVRESFYMTDYLVKYYRNKSDINNLSNCLSEHTTVLISLGEADEALKYAKEQEEICRKVLNWQGVINSLGNQANILFGRSELNGALELLLEGLDICDKLENKNLKPKILNNIAKIHFTRRELDKSLEIYKESELICRETQNMEELSRSLFGQANILHAKGNLEEAMKLYKEEERIRTEIGDKRGLLGSLGNQASILNNTGNSGGAIRLLKKLERMCIELGDKDTLQLCLSSQANAFHLLGKPYQAMNLYKEQERICIERGYKDGLAMSFNGQANILCNQGKIAEAMALYKEAERICLETGDKNGLLGSLGKQANILCHKGNFEEAMKIYKEIEVCYTEMGDRNGLILTLNSQAKVLFIKGDMGGAMKLYKEEERLCRELNDV